MGVQVRQHPKGSGVWYLFITHKGRRKAKRIGKDKRIAIDAAKKIEAKLVLGDLDLERINSRCPTFREHAELWLSLPNDRKPSTTENYVRTLRRHIYPAFGDMRLDEVKRKDIKLLFDRLLTTGMKTSSFSYIKAAIRATLEHAMDSELISSNPMHGLRLKNDISFIVDPLTEEEAFSLLEQSKEYLLGQYYPPLLCSLRTGMRLGEIQALEWKDIDFENRLIHVSKSYSHGVLSTTKNKRIRKVDMSKHLAETLKELRLLQKKIALKTGKQIPDRVFTTERGALLGRDGLRKALHTCLQRAHIRKIRIHDLRHSYATIRLLRGHSIGDVSYQLGHSSISITFDVYGHWIPGKFKSEVDELDMQAQQNATHPQLDER